MAGTRSRSTPKASGAKKPEQSGVAGKRKALDAATASAAKRTKTSPAAKVVQAIKGDDAAAAIGKKGAKQARPQRQAPAAKISATSARAAEEVDVGSSDSESGSDGGAVIEGLDFSSEDDEVEVKAVAHAVGKSGKDVSEVARATRARKARTSVEADGMVAADGGPEEDRGVMYVGHLPNGFFEHEMRAYFSQFGTVTRLRVSRNKRTGASKGYAFIEFESADVCEIAAKTMDHYLLFNHILRCKVIPKEQVPEGLWKGANRRFKVVPWAKLEGRQLAEPASEATWNKRIDKEQKRRSKRAAKLKDMGYEFEAPKIKAVEDVEKAGETAAPTEPEVVTTTLEAGAASVDKAAVTSLEETKDVSQAPAEEKAPAKTRHAKQAKKTGKKVEV